MINNSGLSGPPFDLTSIHAMGSSTAWATDGVGFPFDYFASRPSPVVTFSLAATYQLDEIVVWNYAGGPGGGSGNGASSITATFSTTGSMGDFQNGFAIRPSPGGNMPTPAQVFSLPQSVLANAVRFTITDNFWGASGGDRVGLSEVKFVGTLVPEPSTSALAALASLSLGFIWYLHTYRRRRA